MLSTFPPKISLSYLITGFTVTSVAEELKYNARLTKTKEEFVEIMENLGLARPKKIGVSSGALVVVVFFPLQQPQCSIHS